MWLYGLRPKRNHLRAREHEIFRHPAVSCRIVSGGIRDELQRLTGETQFREQVSAFLEASAAPAKLRINKKSAYKADREWRDVSLVPVGKLVELDEMKARNPYLNEPASKQAAENIRRAREAKSSIDEFLEFVREHGLPPATGSNELKLPGSGFRNLRLRCWTVGYQPNDRGTDSFYLAEDGRIGFTYLTTPRWYGHNSTAGLERSLAQILANAGVTQL